MTASVERAAFVTRKYVGPRVDEVPEGGRFIGDLVFQVSSMSGQFAVIGVSTSPGATAFTRTSGASANASNLVDEG